MVETIGEYKRRKKKATNDFIRVCALGLTIFGLTYIARNCNPPLTEGEMRTNNYRVENKMEEELKHVQAQQNIDNLTKKVDFLYNSLTKEMMDYGMTKDVAGRMLLEQKVIPCPYCHTPNMYEFNRNKKTGFSMMMCDLCDKSYMLLDKDDHLYSQ